MECWVTGATGQIGAVLCRQLEQSGNRVVELSRRHPESTAGRTWLPWDAGLPVELPDDLPNPDAVFLLGGQTSAYTARRDPAADAVVNVIGMLNLLEAVRRRGAQPFVIHTGAATEVGLVTSRSVTDDLPDHPPTFYEVGKVAQRLYLQQYRAEGWLDSATLRLANVYGGVATNGPPTDRGFLNSSMRAALAGKDLCYYGDGDYVRDFIHVDDAVAALIEALAHRDTTGGEAFMIGTNVGTRMQDALTLIADEAALLTGRRPKVIEVDAPDAMYPIDRRETVVDSSRFSLLTDWAAKVPLTAGVRSTLRAMSATG